MRELRNKELYGAPGEAVRSCGADDEPPNGDGGYQQEACSPRLHRFAAAVAACVPP